MDIKDQLRVLFPNHKEIKKKVPETSREFVLQDQILICKYEKRNGKPLTMIEGYHGNVSDFKNLTKKLTASLYPTCLPLWLESTPLTKPTKVEP